MSNRFKYPFNPIPWHSTPHDFSGDHNLGIYATETTQRYICGTRYTMWDGRVFKYAKTGDSNYTLNNDFACRWAHSVAQSYDEVNTTNAIGDTSFIMDGGSHTTFAKDELAGGYVIIYKDGGGGNTQFRGIVGNDYSYTDLDVTVYLDAPLAKETVGTTTSCEIWHNPYTYLATAAAATTHGFAGKPVVQVTVANTYFWLQTWGMCWMAHNSSTSAFSNSNQRACFRADGSYEAEYGDDNRGATSGANMSQIAGNVIVRDAGPLLYMMVSI